MADIVLDRSAPVRLRRLRLSSSLATAGAAFSAEVLDRTAGTELRLTGNPGNRYSLTGTTLTGRGLRRGIDTPSITEMPGSSGALGPRETEFVIAVSHDPTVPAFVRPGSSGGDGAPDVTPDPFSFVGAAGATLSTVYPSNTITIAGIDAASPVSITGGTWSKNGGSYSASAGTVLAGDTVTVRATSSASPATAVAAVLTVGGVPASFTVTTAAAPVFTTQPSMSPTSGAAGSTVFTFSKGAASNSTQLVGRVLLNGTQVAGDVASYTSNLAGNLVLEVAAIGPGGSTVATSPASVVAAAFPAAASYDSDDFETAGLFSAPRPLWTSETGATAAATLEAFGGYAHNKTFATADRFAMFGADRGADFELTFGYDLTGNTPDKNNPDSASWGANFQQYLFWYQDSSNFMKVTFDRPNSRVGISGTMNGSAVAVSYFAAPSMPIAGSFVLQAKNGKFRARLNGKWLTINSATTFPFDEMDFSAKVAAGKRLGKVGFSQGRYTWPVLQDIAAKAQDVTIDFIDGFVGRDALSGTGSTGGTATLEINAYAGTPNRYIGRVLDYATRAVVQDWTDLGASGEAATMGGVRKTIFLPTGGPYIVEAGYVDGGDGKRHTALSRRVLSGRRLVIYGQSNSANRATAEIGGYVFPAQAASMVTGAGTYVAAPAYAAVNGGIKSTREWAQVDSPYNPNSGIETAKAVAVALGQPVSAQVLGKGGVTIDYLTNGDGWTDFTGGLAYGKGIVEAVIWDQGEGDADGASPPNGYATAFATLVSKMRTATGNANLPVLIALVGRYASASSPNGTYANNDSYREVLRQQQLVAVAADPTRVFISSSKLGLVHSDAYHYTTAGYQEVCRRDGVSVANRVFGTSGGSGLGPRPTTFTLASNRIDFTIELDLDGATGLTDLVTVNTGTVPTASLSGGLYGYQISLNDFAALLPIATLSVDRSGSSPKLVGTLSAAAPAGTLKVRSFYGSSFDDTNLFYGTRADGNIPIRPISAPLTMVGL